LLGVRLNGNGIMEPKAFAFEGERGESGESIVRKLYLVSWCVQLTFRTGSMEVQSCKHKVAVSVFTPNPCTTLIRKCTDLDI
jgi:hypothetical protein